jgi:hypothetical protein
MNNIFTTKPVFIRASVVFLLAISLLTGCLPVKITDTAVRPGKAGGIYHYKIAAKGGSGKFTFSLASGTLPSGVTLGTDGTIQGTVLSGTGDYPFTIKVEDNIFKSQMYKAEKSYTLKIDNIPYKWTLIAHFAVDNNIDYEFEKQAGTITQYLNTLEAIKAADKDNVLQIIVMMDAYNSKTTFSDGYYYLSGGTFAADKEVSLSEINSGSVDDNKAFLNWAAETYPSEHYIYSIFNHGGGFDDNTIDGRLLSIGIDETDKDSLTHYEVGVLCDYLKALTGKNISIFYPFACLMGGVELAYELSGSVDYILFSEELFPAALFSYQGMESITADPDITSETLGKTICDNAYQVLAGNSIEILRSDFTISLIDESKMANLSLAIDAYATDAIADINSNHAHAFCYNSAADNSYSMMENVSSDYDDFYYIDFGNYLSNIISDADLPVSVKEKASLTISAYDDMVVYARNYNYPDTTGMTIFHNIWGSDNEYPPTLYKELLKFGASPWGDYIELLGNEAP